MAQNEKTGSDLDVFEGLGKKAPSTHPPNGSRSVPPAPPPVVRAVETKRTLLGVAAPTLEAALPPSPARTPPPPPGRATLPPVVVAPAGRTSSIPPPPPGESASEPGNGTASVAANANPAVDMDWDEEDEATHIFDEQSESTKVFDEEANQNTAAGEAYDASAAIPKAKPTLLGLSAPPPPPTGTPSTIPPPNAGLRPATSRPPPPPPNSGVGAFGRSSGFPGVRPSGMPPPTITPFPPAMATQPGLGTIPPSRAFPSSMPPPGGYPIPRPAAVPDFLSGQRRMMEATAMVRPPQNRTGLFVALGVAGVVVIAGMLFLPSHPGRILINVADTQGSAVNHLEVFVDGRKQCDTAPCIVDQVGAGLHDVKVLADGYDAPPVQSVAVESRKDSAIAFSLGSTAGTGIRVGGTQPGVKLYVDDKESGPLPQELRDLTPGDHVIKVAGSERYQPLEKHVSIERQKVQDLGTVTLKVLKGKATISLGTPGARVFLVSGADRRELPMLPISVDIDTAKTWALEANRPGFMDYRQPISFDDGQAERTYVVSLDPRAAGGGWASTASYGGGGGPAPMAAARPAPHAAAAPQEAAAASQGQGDSAGASEGNEAFLNINSIPPSTCFLDGRALGSTPKVHITVKPGAHTVKFVNSDEGLTKTVSVSVGAGETKPAVAKLN
jgi:hypothetical protein